MENIQIVHTRACVSNYYNSFVLGDVSEKNLKNLANLGTSEIINLLKMSSLLPIHEYRIVVVSPTS